MILSTTTETERPDPLCHYCPTFAPGVLRTGFCPEHMALLPQAMQDIWHTATEARLHCTPYESLPYKNIQLEIIRHYRPARKPKPSIVSLKDLGLA